MIKLVHVLILIIVAFMLYYLSRCNDYNGFSVGSQVVNCSPLPRLECDRHNDCLYINGSCQNVSNTTCEELTNASYSKILCSDTTNTNKMKKISGAPCIWAKYSASGAKCQSESETTCEELGIFNCNDEVNVSGSPCVWAKNSNSKSKKKCQSASKTTCKELGFIACADAESNMDGIPPSLIVSNGPCIISASGLKCKSASDTICKDLYSDECLSGHNNDAIAQDGPCKLDGSRCVPVEPDNKNYISISDGLKLSNNCND